MSILKLSYELGPLTLSGLHDGSITVGDILIPPVDIPSVDGKKILFYGDKEYPILEVYPNQKNAEGVIVASTQGRWFIHFNSLAGGYKYFGVVRLNPEESLGKLEMIPLFILRLFNKYPGQALKRNEIISEIQHQLYSTNPKERARIRQNTEHALYLLEQTERILPGNTIGSFIISPKGKEDLLEKSTPENLGE